jgi:hypothetical protein
MWLSVVLTVGLLLPGISALAADPGAKCGKAAAIGVASCIQKANAASVKCFKKTGVGCLPGDAKIAKALEAVDKKVLSDCADDAAVADAGYAPLTVNGLLARLQNACTREVAAIAARVFGGPSGPIWAGADKAEEGCLQTAGKEPGKVISKSLKKYAACAKGACDLVKIETLLAQTATKAEDKLDKKCSDLAGLIGVDATTLVSAAREQVGSAASSPCDPLESTRCLFPLPNDYYSVLDPTSASGRRIAFVPEAMPANSSSVPIDPTSWNVLDGFSVGPMALLQVPDLDLTQTGAVPITDLARALDPDAPVVMIDADTGEKQLIWVERDQSGPDPNQRPIMIRVGKNLPNGKRFIIALRNLRDGLGAAIPADPVFAAYRDATPTNQVSVEARRPHMEQLFATLAAAGIARNELFLAWDFTTQSIESTSRKLLHMRDDAFDNVLATSAPAFTVDNIDEPLDANIFRRVDGTFEAPLYLTDNGVPGSLLRLDPNTGLPKNEGDSFTALFRCIIPYAASTGGAAPAVPARPSLYGHGLLGSERQTSSGHVRDMASEGNFIMCGTRWTGFEEDDELDTVFPLLQDFSNFPKFIERQHQGVLNFMVLARLLIDPNGFASDAAFQVGGESMIDPNDVFYDGNSQGGILGGVLAAFSQDVTRFVLGVPGINYSTLLRRSVDFDPFNVVLEITYPNGFDRAILLSVAQMMWDQTDPSGHVNHTLSDTYANTPPKKILYQVAFGDHQVAPVTVEVAARSNGALIQTPILSPLKVLPEVEPYYDISAIPSYPFDGSAMVIWDSGNPAPPIGNQAPRLDPNDPEWADLLFCPTQYDGDPHECPRRQPEARLQKSEFLKTNGAIIDTCSGAPCLAPLN